MSALFNLTACDSKSKMEERLRASSRAVMVGADAESPRSFYTIALHGDNPLIVGLSISGLGPKPSVAASRNGEHLLIGHDRSLTVVDVPSGKIVVVHSLDGAFFQFLEPFEKNVVAIHELGALQVSFDGAVGWTVSSSDIVENFRVEDGRVLELSVADSVAPLRVSLADGRKLK